MTTARTYDASTANRGFLRNVLSIVELPATVWQHRYMLQNFLRRDLLSRVHGSMLGIGWILLQPMFMFAVYFVVFGIIMGPRTADGGPDPNLAMMMFSGIIVFHALTDGTSISCTLIIDNGNLVKKVAFPSEVLLVHVATSSMVIFSVGAVVCVVAGMALGVAQPGWLLLAEPLVMLVQFALTMGLGMILATLNIFIRDTVHIWRIAAMAWLFLSPVFWQMGHMADKVPPWVLWVLEMLNPAFPLLQAHRLALGGIDPSLGAFWPQLGVAAAWAFGLLLVGFGCFMSRKHKFTDLI